MTFSGWICSRHRPRRGCAKIGEAQSKASAPRAVCVINKKPDPGRPTAEIEENMACGSGIKRKWKLGPKNVPAFYKSLRYVSKASVD